MSEVRRFRFFSTCDCGNVFGYDFEEDENGGWVDYHDYKKLEQQKAKLIQLLKEIDENVLTEWPYEYLHYRNRVAEIINK